MSNNVALNVGVVKFIVNHWFDIKHERTTICLDDLTNLIHRFCLFREMCFSTTYRSQVGWKLLDRNRLLKRVHVKDDDYRKTKWILADTPPMISGVHCWRIQLKNPKKGWLSVGVAKQNEMALNQRAFGGRHVWAIGVCAFFSFFAFFACICWTGLNNNWYPSSVWADYKQCDTERFFRLSFIELDVRIDFNTDRVELRICAVNHDQELIEAVLSEMPDDGRGGGWVPYLNMYYNDAVRAEVRGVFIDPNKYGIPIGGLFL